ncbi:MAG TPA: SHOCT domain-containing protein [Ktedonobacteraceae bacterium]|nr:SHOCT domain-containing protein [Ktedonobacteraceae bacterium]
MLRRRPVVGQRRGPGLLRTAATTAVVAGTATAVSKGVSGSMDKTAMSKQQQMEQQQVTQNAADQAQAELEQMKAQLAAMQAQQLQADQAQATAAAAPSAQPDLITQLQRLTQLKQSGALSEDEFQAAKAKLLSS